jgi:protein-disulfide isomerase
MINMRKDLLILLIVAGVVICAALVGSSYYKSSLDRARQEPSAALNSALVRDDSPTLGAPDSTVALVEFADPECESCAAFAPVIKKLLGEYDGKLRFVLRYMPLHPNSIPAGNFMEAAGEQGKFWQAQELLFRRQSEWGERHGAPSTAPKPDVATLFERYATDLGLDTNRVIAAISQNKFGSKLERDRRDGQTLGVRQTPTIFVNGRRLTRLSESDLRILIEEELKK